VKSGDRPIDDPALAILVRIYRARPELLPRDRDLSLKLFWDYLGGEAAVAPRDLALLLGREQTAGNRWFKKNDKRMAQPRVQGRAALQQIMIVLMRLDNGSAALETLKEAAFAESAARDLNVFVHRKGWGRAGEIASQAIADKQPTGRKSPRVPIRRKSVGS